MSNDENKLTTTTYLPNYSLNRYFLTYLLKIEDAYSFNILLFARWFIHSLQHFFFQFGNWIFFCSYLQMLQLCTYSNCSIVTASTDELVVFRK